MISAVCIEVLLFSNYNYIFRTIFFFTGLAAITEFVFNRKLTATGKLARFGIFALLIFLILAPSIPLAIKSDYLELKEVTYAEDTNRTDDYIINIKVKFWCNEGIRSKFGSTSQVIIKIIEYEGTLQPMSVTSKTLRASDCEGKVKEIWFNTFNVENGHGSFKAQVYIRPSNVLVDASPYTVERLCQLSYGDNPDVDDDPYAHDPTGDLWFSNVKIEWYDWQGDLIAFGIKVSVYNSYSVDLKEAYFELEDYSNDLDFDGKEKHELGSIVSKQSRTATFKVFTTEEKDEFDIKIEIHGLINGDHKTESKTIEVDTNAAPPPEPPAPQPNQSVDSPSMFSELFAQVMQDPSMQPIFVLILIGFPVVIIGAGLDSKRLMGIGAFIECVPAGLSIFSVILGWTPPAQYFVELAGDIAPLAQAMITLFVVAIVISVTYTLAGIVGSVRE